MDYDPLSPPSRRARRSLLAISSITILATFFCAKIKELPIGGAGISLDSGFLDAALIAGLVYFVVLLAIYLRVDFVNRGETPATKANAEARKAALIEVERRIRGAAIGNSIDFNARKFNETVVEDIVGVFWRFKSEPDVDTNTLHTAFAATGIDDRAFDDLEKQMRDAWQYVTDRTSAESDRAKISIRDERRRFLYLEAGFPFLIALIAVAVFVSADWSRSLIGLSPCDAELPTCSEIREP